MALRASIVVCVLFCAYPTVPYNKRRCLIIPYRTGMRKRCVEACPPHRYNLRSLVQSSLRILPVRLRHRIVLTSVVYSSSSLRIPPSQNDNDVYRSAITALSVQKSEACFQEELINSIATKNRDAYELYVRGHEGKREFTPYREVILHVNSRFPSCPCRPTTVVRTVSVKCTSTIPQSTGTLLLCRVIFFYQQQSSYQSYQLLLQLVQQQFSYAEWRILLHVRGANHARKAKARNVEDFADATSRCLTN